MEEAARNAIAMINGFTSTTKIILEPVTASSGASNIIVSGATVRTDAIAKFNPDNNDIGVRDTVAAMADTHQAGMTNVLGHELLHFLGLAHNSGATQLSLMTPCAKDKSVEACLQQAAESGGMQLKDAEMLPYCSEIAKTTVQTQGSSTTQGGWPGDPPNGRCYTAVVVVDTYYCYRDIEFPTERTCVYDHRDVYTSDHWCEDLQNAPMARLGHTPLSFPADVAYTPANLLYTPANLASMPANVADTLTPADSACPSAERSISVGHTCGRH